MASCRRHGVSDRQEAWLRQTDPASTIILTCVPRGRTNMPNVRLPLSGDVTQTINPWNWMLNLVGSQFGLININLGKSADPQLEEQILEDVGSYGRQLGRIGDVLGVLLKHVKLADLSDDEKKKIWAFESQLTEIERLKAQRPAPLRKL
jgi:hypothetical protein